MDKNISDYFHQVEGEGSPGGEFNKVLALHERHDWDWEELRSMAPSLPRGWYELSQLSSEDRVEFTREHWLAKLPFQPHMLERLEFFFSRLDTIGIFLTKQKSSDEEFSPHFVYSIKEDGGFFQGAPPANEEEMATLQETFAPTILPADYCAFLRIHNGFQKGADTGVLPIVQVPNTFQSLQEQLSERGGVMLKNGEQLNPRNLIPFYVSFGQHCYQCFWKEWFEESEIGNVYYSGIEHSLSEPQQGQDADINMAFPTFLGWLMFYLEGIGC